MILPTKEFLKIFKQTEGALSVCESIAIMNIAAQVKEDGLYLECGTYKGKGSLSAAYSFKGGVFYLLDPIFEDEKLRQEVEKFVACFDIDNGLSVVALPKYSTDFIAEFSEKYNFDDYAYVFIDSGSHQDGLPMMEVKLLEDKIVQNGIIAFHDYRSQFIEVEEAYNYLLSTGKYEEIRIDWQEIIEYAKENDLERNNNSWHHQDVQFPCFVGALKRK